MIADIRPAGDAALTVAFEARISPEVNARIRAFTAALERAGLPGVTECVPAYCSVLVCYRPERIRYGELQTRLKALLDGLDAQHVPAAETIEIPVLYGGEFGPDLSAVAGHNGLSADEVVRIHASSDYLVYMLGFTPGFPYLGGMDARIAMPRLAEPRARIPAGSVGIAGAQTGVYPTESPGGWRLIGRTPLRLYDPDRATPILLRTGQRVRFCPIDRAEYERLLKLEQTGRPAR